MAKIERTKNATRNIIFGIILKVYQILVPFLMRTAMIYLMGVQYLGLNSLFTSVLQVLNLAELGVGCVIFVSCIATCFVCSKVNVGLIATLVIRSAICVIFPNLIYLLAYYKRMEFTDSLLLVNKMTKGKIWGLLTKLGMRE